MRDKIFSNARNNGWTTKNDTTGILTISLFISNLPHSTSLFLETVFWYSTKLDNYINLTPSRQYGPMTKPTIFEKET